MKPHVLKNWMIHRNLLQGHVISSEFEHLIHDKTFWEILAVTIGTALLICLIAYGIWTLGPMQNNQPYLYPYYF